MSNRVISPVRHVENAGTLPVVLPSGDDRWEAVLRISNSRAFEKSPRIRELLLFVARKSFEGQTEQLSEYEIGRAVFGRLDSYIPTEDSIVRSSIRQLRRKLAEYYESEGRTETSRLEIPKGSYVAQFRFIEPECVDQPVHPSDLAETSIHRPRRSMRQMLLWVVLTLSLVANVFLFVATRQSAPGTEGRRTGLIGALVTRNSEPTQLVLDDYAYVLLQRLSAKKVLAGRLRESYVHRPGIHAIA